MPPFSCAVAALLAGLLVPLAIASCLPVRRTAPPASTVRVLVDLDAQVDLAELGRRLARQGLGKRERRAKVVAALAAVAERSQARLRPFLEKARRDGLIRSWQGFTVVNRLLVEATPEGIEMLARRKDVVAIVPETEPPESALALAFQDAAGSEKVSWGPAAIGAQAAWQQGLDGTGVVVGVIDSGATAVHEQLAGGFRGGERSWLDPAGGSAAPRDTRFGHGTGVLSCAVGRNVAGFLLGVAPGARWIACAGLPEGHYNNVLATQCADWMLNAGQPDVLIAAWVLPAGGCDRSLQPIVDAWRAAEILPVFPAGNHGPEPRTDRSPANYTGLYPGDRAALSIGGIDRNGGPFAESSRGPGACGGPVFPLLMAPAEELVTAFPLAPSTYLRARGTSFAAGLAAGAAALLIQAEPEASIAAIEEALTAGASDLGPPGPDGTFGHGRLDIPGALGRLRGIRGSIPGSAAPGVGRPDRWSGW